MLHNERVKRYGIEGQGHIAIRPYAKVISVLNNKWNYKNFQDAED
jgi:hypothetical protein